MFWIIAAVIVALIMLILMSKRTETEEDPVWQTVIEVDHLADEIARWETNLWPLWVMAVVESMVFRLDKADRLPYLHKLEDQIVELQQELCENESMFKIDWSFPYFEQKTNDSQTP